MKKSICLLLVVVVAMTGVFAAQGDVASVSLLINDDLNRNYNQIAAYSGNLTDTDRMVLYSSYEQSPTVPFVINLLVGLGIGSYVQGDSAGGTTGLIGELCSYAAIAGGYGLLFAGGMLSSVSAPNGGAPVPDQGLMAAGTVLCIAGGAAWLGFRIYECIRPFTYSKNYNQKLRSALYNIPVLAVVPVIQSPSSNELGVAVMAKVSF